MAGAITNPNENGYEARLDVVRNILKDFGLEGTEITPVAYLDGPFPFNNYIFKVTLSSPATAEFFQRAHNSGGDAFVQPCVIMPPQEGVRTLVVRLSNPAAPDLNNANRVQNEVASMQLARESLARRFGDAYGALVPMVFAWKAADEGMLRGEVEMAEEGFGWTMMEFVEGEDMDVCFKRLDLEEKLAAVREIAKIFAAIQGAKLPVGVNRHGGLTVDRDGRIVNGQGTMLQGEPWDAYDEFLKAKMAGPLRDADNSSVIRGWKEGGLRERIHHFVKHKLSQVLREAEVDLTKLVLLHVDFTLNNMLYNKRNKRITAVLDFDWSSIGHPFEEFCTSLHDVHGGLHRLSTRELKMAVMTGDFQAGRPEGTEGKEEWVIAEAWDASLRELGATRPSDIQGIETLEKIRSFIEAICPFELGCPQMVRMKSAEFLAEKRAATEKKLVELLQGWGC